MSELVHPSGEFAMVVPDGWTVDFNFGPVAMVAVAPENDVGFLANLTVTVEGPVDDADTDWWVDAPERLVEGLAPARVLDVQWADLRGRVALRILLHHTPLGIPVVLEQWVLPIDDHRWVISASVASLAYDRWADAMQATAESLTFAPSEAHR